jgi:hypothetical protein
MEGIHQRLQLLLKLGSNTLEGAFSTKAKGMIDLNDQLNGLRGCGSIITITTITTITTIITYCALVASSAKRAATTLS